MKTFARLLMSTVKQPQWHKPATKGTSPVLKIYNTLTRQKDEFVPQRPGHCYWYSCGITPYAPSHVGHLSNYCRIDVARRIMEHLGYNVHLVQNVTDVDDKIIVSARQQYLFDEHFIKKYTEVTSELVQRAQRDLQAYVATNLPEYPGENLDDFASWSAGVDVASCAKEKPKLPMYIALVNKAYGAIVNKPPISEFLAATKDIIAPVIDAEYGATVTDPSIFRALPYYWENKFNEEMAKLNVLPADVTTRVTEYVPEIVAYVEKIIENGYAYPTADGLVYFDVVKFENDPNHDYAKLQPWNKGDMLLIADGEGLLSTGSGKKNPVDFALWKALKPGEPFWQSPWGQGRPGWHIECSVMALDIVGSTLDIHSGGADLCFPHHDNELAQSEAYYNNKQWVNYFMHTGHLHVQGQKMSKSLKNFITIEEALREHSPRQLRLVFAMSAWDKPIDFKPSLIQDVRAFESAVLKFFTNVRALYSDSKHQVEAGEVVSKKLGDDEKALFAAVDTAEDEVHASLCDNFGTPQAFRILADLVGTANTYIAANNADIRIEPLVAVAKYITKMLDVFGFPARADRIGWELLVASGDGASAEDTVMPYVKQLSQFRDTVRGAAISKDDPLVILKACDDIRALLLQLNVSLDDRPTGALVKFLNDEDKAAILKQQQDKERLAAEKEAKKAAQAAANAKKEAERLEKMKIAPQDMFKDSALYKEWDEQGMPTIDIHGEEVSKSMKKKLAKQYAAQEKLHKEYLEKHK